MLFIKHLSLDLFIKNNDEEFNYTDIVSKYKDNKYLFNIDSDEYEIEIDDKIVFHKKNNESEIDFIFDNNIETNGTYYIKELDFYMDAKVKTTKLIIKNNLIDIEYKLWLQNEEIGNFIFKIKVKE